MSRKVGLSVLRALPQDTRLIVSGGIDGQRDHIPFHWEGDVAQINQLLDAFSSACEDVQAEYWRLFAWRGRQDSENFLGELDLLS